MNTNDRTKQPSHAQRNAGPGPARASTPETRRPYEAPRVTRKRSVQRATLFSGGGVTATGLTTGG